MAVKRAELNEMELENVVGGAYRFKDAGDGTYMMKNTNYSGEWHLNPANYGNVLQYTSEHGTTAEIPDVIAYMQEQGWIY